MALLQLAARTTASVPLSKKHAGGVVLAIILSLMPTVTACRPNLPLASDAYLEDQLRLNKADFEILVKMFNEDSNLGRVAPGFTSLMKPFSPGHDETGISRARWDEYRRLFGKLGLDGGLGRWEDPQGAIAFLAKGRGFSVAGESKGYIYSPHLAPSPLVSSLDNGVPSRVPPPVPPHTAAVAFKQVDQNWYLFYMRD